MEEKKKGKTQKNNKEGKQKDPKWKKQSEELRAIIKQNREFDNKSGNAFVNVPSSITDDYTLCDMCGRKYNEQAYNKHLPTCDRKTKEALLKNKGKAPTTSSNKPNLNVRFKK